MRKVCVRGSHYKLAKDKYTPLLIAKAKKIVARTGKLTIPDIVQMADEFSLPIKTSFKFLEYAGVIPTGTWERKIEWTRARTPKGVRDAMRNAK